MSSLAVRIYFTLLSLSVLTFQKYLCVANAWHFTVWWGSHWIYEIQSSSTDVGVRNVLPWHTSDDFQWRCRGVAWRHGNNPLEFVSHVDSKIYWPDFDKQLYNLEIMTLTNVLCIYKDHIWPLTSPQILSAFHKMFVIFKTMLKILLLLFV